MIKNKLFFAFVLIFFLGLAIASPILNILMTLGVIPYENSGNIIEVDKVYEEDFPLSGVLNGFEEGKRIVRDTYTNHLPFYLEMSAFTKDIQRKINHPVNQYFSDKSDEIYLANRLNRRPARP